jgi:sortase A
MATLLPTSTSPTSTSPTSISRTSTSRTADTSEPPSAERPLFLPSAALTILSVLALTFALSISLVGAVKHARDQQTAFATLRGTLANATTPVAQLDEAKNVTQPGTPIAVLDIPQLNLREVVVEGTSSGVLMAGPGHRRDTPFPGQPGTSVIFGRQAAYGAPFRSLGDLVAGNVFSITTGQGRQVFRVVTVRRAGDLEPPVLEAGKSRVTLVTSAGTPWAPDGNLLRVDADLVGNAQQGGSRPMTYAMLPTAEREMQGDQSAWIWILLMSQALVAASLGVTWARYRWGRWQVWLAGGPLLLALGLGLSNFLAELLPNLL